MPPLSPVPISSFVPSSTTLICDNSSSLIQSIPIDSISIGLPLHPLPPPQPNSYPMLTRSKAKQPTCFTVSSYAFTSEPTFVNDALHSLVWLKSMQEEFQAL